MKKNYLLNLVLLLISIFFINSCRQELTVYEEANLKRETDFFKNAETKINKIDGGIELLELLKSENEKTQFVSKLSDQKGIPVWDKIIIDKSFVQNKDGDTTNEQRILIPLTEDDIFMSSYITVKINENDEVTELDNISNKKLYDIIHNTTISKDIRETIISNIIFTNYQTFGYKKFMNIPEDLFPDVPLDSGKTTKTIQLSSEENNSSPSNSIGSKQMQLVCFTYEVETCGSCGHYTTFTKCSYVYVDYGGGSGGDGGYGGTGNPGNGGGGGTGTGTGNNTPWYLMNPNIDIYTYNSNVRGVFKSLTDFNIILEKEHLDYIQPKSALTNTLRNCLTNNTIYKSTFVYSLLDDYAFAYPTPDANILNNKLTSFYSTLFSINPKVSWLDFFRFFNGYNTTSFTSNSFNSFINNNKSFLDKDTGDLNNNIQGGYDTTIYADFDFENQQVQWPEIAPVIPLSQFVGWRHEKKADGNWLHCMDFVKEQIAKKGYKISNYGDAGQTFQIYTEQNKTNLTDLYKGISYLKYALSNGIPVVVGIDDKKGHPGNLDKSTDHFVVIIGMGTDSKGRYFRFYDNASSDPNQGAHPENKLYIKYPDRIFTGKTQCSGYRDRETEYDYIITMIRKSK